MMKKKCMMCVIVIFMTFIMYQPRMIMAEVYSLQQEYPEIMFYQAHTDEKVIALTFDDGPDLRFTPTILDILNFYQVKATFFLLGIRTEMYPEVAKRIVQEGHHIGNHTFGHSNLIETKNLYTELDQGRRAIKAVVGVDPYLFRAPFGALSRQQVEKLGEWGFKGIGWSIDSEDWRSLKADEIVDHVMSQIHPGGIILMHSAGYWTQDLSGTAEALKVLIPTLLEQGYRFVTVAELMSYEK